MASPHTPKSVLMVNQASTTNGATAAGSVDTKGFDFARISVYLTTTNATGTVPDVLKIGEGATTSSYSDVSGYVGGTDFTLPTTWPTAATDITGPFAVFNVPLAARERYLQVSVSPNTTQLVTATCDLLRADDAPNSAADANASVLVEKA